LSETKKGNEEHKPTIKNGKKLEVGRSPKKVEKEN
jgi:hypothetical protein